MTLESLHLSTVLPASAERIYRAWLDSALHAAFTGSAAEIDPVAGGHFTAWDGYIQGTNLELEPFHRILQSWRTTDFPEDSADSRLEVLLEPVEEGTQITIHHSEIPEGQGEDYRQGWEDFYFKPMADYFSESPD